MIEDDIDHVITVRRDGHERDVDIYTPEGMAIVGDLYTRAGWVARHYDATTWLGVPVQQLASDLLVMQELIHRVRPTVVVETGVKFGGSAIFYASMLRLLGGGTVVSVDITDPQIRRRNLEQHPLGHMVRLLIGDSLAEETRDRVAALVPGGATTLVALDANHTYAHVRAELEAYAPLVTPGSYLVVFDGVMERLADTPDGDPSWRRDNPRRATLEFLAEHPEFELDASCERFGATYCPDGFLRRRAQPGDLGAVGGVR